ncbi:hypothetical protein BGV40_04305 [Methanosarcina sp. Ant1]|nr:hypothetical protein BGV40_04305 [Methanosarcina sp. Ant1]
MKNWKISFLVGLETQIQALYDQLQTKDENSEIAKSYTDSKSAETFYLYIHYHQLTSSENGL